MGKFKADSVSVVPSTSSSAGPVVLHRQSSLSQCVAAASDNSVELSVECHPRRRMIVNLDQVLWKYRAEGNANLVLALPHTRQVLRLKKVDVVVVGRPIEARGDPNENFQFLKSVVDYIKEISTLLLEDFCIDPQLVILLLKDMELFNKQLSQFRPVDRLAKEIRFPFGIMYPDVTFLPTYLTATSVSELRNLINERMNK